VDESLPMRVESLSAGDRVTVWLTNQGPDGQIWAASATFLARGAAVDLARDAPVSGSYAGVDPMGLFWSRAITPVADLPAGMEVAHAPGVIAVTAQVNGGPFLPAQRTDWTFLGPGVTVRDLREQGLVGKFYLPAAQEAATALIVLGGSTGGLIWSREVAALLATRGFATLALAYFAMEGLPPTLDRIPLEYFERAVGWVKSQPEVAQARIGVCGMSRGGELALLLASKYPEFKAVVAYVPSGTVWCGVPPIGHSAWSYQGRKCRLPKDRREWSGRRRSQRAPRGTTPTGTGWRRATRLPWRQRRSRWKRSRGRCSAEREGRSSLALQRVRRRRGAPVPGEELSACGPARGLPRCRA
jgi:pimeloyl-ACP methyl ester carboxylesterase